jgi:F-type H+-transporting ATPase subunit delta
MDDLNTIARPYAQAALAQATEEGKVAEWSEMLGFLAGLAKDPTMSGIIANPRVEGSRLSDLVLQAAEGRLSETGVNFARILVANGRLNAAAFIAQQFEAAKAALEGRRQVEVVSARELTDAQREDLAKTLAAKLGYEVEQTVVEDTSLLGGVLVRAGDLVIDASMRGRLAQLANALGAAA